MRASSQFFLPYECESTHKRISLSEFAGSKRFLDGVLIRERKLKRRSTVGVSGLNERKPVAILDNLGRSVWRLASTAIRESQLSVD